MTVVSTSTKKGKINAREWTRLMTYNDFKDLQVLIPKIKVCRCTTEGVVQVAEFNNVPTRDIFDMDGGWDIDIVDYNILKTLNHYAEEFIEGKIFLDFYGNTYSLNGSALNHLIASISYSKITNDYDILFRTPYENKKEFLNKINYSLHKSNKETFTDPSAIRLINAPYTNMFEYRYFQFNKAEKEYETSKRVLELYKHCGKVTEPSYDL